MIGIFKSLTGIFANNLSMHACGSLAVIIPLVYLLLITKSDLPPNNNPIDLYPAFPKDWMTPTLLVWSFPNTTATFITIHCIIIYKVHFLYKY